MGIETLCCGGILGLITISLPRWILFPLFAKAIKPNANFQFRVTDLGSLFAYLSVAFAAGTAPRRMGFFDFPAPDGTLLLTASLAIVAGCIWWIGIRTLTQAGITGPGRRASLMFFVLPVVYPASAVLPGLSLYMVATSVLDRESPVQPAVVAEVLLLILLVACRWISKWIADERRAGRCESAIPSS